MHFSIKYLTTPYNRKLNWQLARMKRGTRNILTAHETHGTKHTMLFIPPYHPFLNRLAFSYTQSYEHKNNRFIGVAVASLTRNEFRKISNFHWHFTEIVIYIACSHAWPILSTHTHTQFQRNGGITWYEYAMHCTQYKLAQNYSPMESSIF